HTRCYRDWSSDVCSSDLGLKIEKSNLQRWQASDLPRAWIASHQGNDQEADRLALLDTLQNSEFGPLDSSDALQVLDDQRIRYHKIGRASCREREYMSVGT